MINACILKVKPPVATWKEKNHTKWFTQVLHYHLKVWIQQDFFSAFECLLYLPRLNLFDQYFVKNNVKVFTATFDKFNVSLLNKRINFLNSSLNNEHPRLWSNKLLTN